MVAANVRLPAIVSDGLHPTLGAHRIVVALRLPSSSLSHFHRTGPAPEPDALCKNLKGEIVFCTRSCEVLGSGTPALSVLPGASPQVRDRA
jgi:hypothetical protein